jgi:AcrR family transcriptional regulator
VQEEGRGTLGGVAGVSEATDPLDGTVDWHRRVIGRSLRSARKRSIDRGSALIRAAATLLERSNGEGFTVQDVADEAGQSLRTLYQYFESKDDLLLAVFEEAMFVYARMIEAAIADLDDPFDRLAGALIAAARLPERSATDINGRLSRLRLKLTGSQPELVAVAQAPLTSLFRGLLRDAVAAGRLEPVDPDAATFLLLALSSAAITSGTLGNTVGLRPPPALEHVAFSLQGLGARLAPGALTAVEARLRLPRRRARR